MSLSFVSSTVQKGTENGGYEETPIETSQQEREAVNRRNANKPLFEQLRENQEEEDAKREELQRQMMRGTRTLDEDDVAHLEALEKQRSDREQAIQEQTKSELAMFRAARALRQQQTLGDDDDKEVTVEDEEEVGSSIPQPTKEMFTTTKQPIVPVPKATVAPVIPKIKVKKRKRKGEENKMNGQTVMNEVKDMKKLGNGKMRPGDKLAKPAAMEAPGTDDRTVAGLGMLLAGYGSSSEED
ncbi:NEFA-interacting nuclear NIP30 family protein [Nitzschia inconspicua]|uniref:NEFA-interacting nuclear NIP30 family protein n=1 Tax=Nitzschia inconspicua TaxID=303405 RepID=A0A9K3K5K7_9STRA|nr:NEFA-interacting nuclear NIP30 family protein [Nitzschia inconspicua]KAG7372431.1 NEFA-interacting nuclear NIP30 family protein [Nitzschia inconspicua]